MIGISPLIWRLGYGRWFRKIAIVAKSDPYNNLRMDLVDSGVFRESNISNIPPNQLAKIKESDLLLVDYQSFNNTEIETILSYKVSKSGMIFYYPNFSLRQNKSIPDDIKEKISTAPYTTIVNFRGRLLNDIVTTLITTSYEKR